MEDCLVKNDEVEGEIDDEVEGDVDDDSESSLEHTDSDKDNCRMCNFNSIIFNMLSFKTNVGFI